MEYITKSVAYVGVDDESIDLFENQYRVPNGMAYNSYIIFDEKIAVMDTVDRRGAVQWLENVTEALGDKQPDYLVIHHMEPDHAGSIQLLAERYPAMKLVGNKKTFTMLGQFFPTLPLPADRLVTVGEGDVLSLGSHTLTFFLAPMVHWPEAMVSFESSEGVLFSADAFGKFGVRHADEDWTCEARRYYFNIVGKYGGPVQTLLKKLSGAAVNVICPLHGPILTEDLGFYIGKYQLWSSYQPEDEGVTIACASIHGHTLHAAKVLAEILEKKGAKKVAFFDLSRDDMAEAVEDAFRYGKLILAASSYDGGVFPPMDDFLHHLASKAYQDRTVGYVQNGSWAPSAAKTMKAVVDGMKNITQVEPVVTITSSLKDADLPALEALADAILA